MNIFFRELKAYRKNVITWSLSIIAVLFASMAKYDVLSSDSTATVKFLEQFPATVQVIFGMNGLDPTTLSGYFGVLFLYTALMLAVHAGLLGADIIAKEEQERTTEFLYVKPRSRSLILTAKLIAALSIIIVINLITLSTSYALAAKYGASTTTTRDLVLFSIAHFILQLLFMTIGMAVAASRWWKSAAKAVALLIFTSYLLSVVASLQPALRTVCSISPFVHFEAASMITSGSLPREWAGVYGVLIITATIATYLMYRRRDLRV